MSSQKEIHWPKSIPRLTTERLVLRGIEASDLEGYFQLNSDSTVMNMYGIVPHKKKAETKNLIVYLHKQFKDQAFLRWGIFEKDTGALVGDIGYWRFLELRARAEVGLKLGRNFWGKGYGTEALTAVTDYSFNKLNLQSIESNVDVENKSSIGLFQKLGFIKVGVIPRHSFSDVTNTYVDTTLLHMDPMLWAKFHKSKKSKR